MEGPLDYYVGFWEENQPETDEETVLSSSDSSYVLEGLEPDTGYQVRVHTLPAGGSFMDNHGSTSPLMIFTQPGQVHCIIM